MPEQAIPLPAIRAIAQAANLGHVREVKRIKTNNNIDRIITSKGLFFCKTYTKPWYGPPEENAYPVLHESGAYETLRRRGLNTPEVIWAATDAAKTWPDLFSASGPDQCM